MYCPHCNSYISDNSRFCSQCGAALSSNSNRQSQYNDNRSYGQPIYNRDFDRNVEPTPPLTVATPIIAIVANIIFPNILALVFGVLSLVSYNKYESSLRSGDIAFAEENKRKSKRYAKVAIILAIVMAVLMIAAAVCFNLLSFFGGAEIIGDEFIVGFAAITCRL